MNSLDYASSDEEEKKVVFHIEIPEKTEIPKKPVIQEKKGLFDLLPKPAQALGSGGESTRIKIPSLKRKAEVVDKVAKDPKVEEEVDLFSISSIQKKPTGVARNHSTLVINPGLEEQVLEYYEEAPDVILEAEKVSRLILACRRDCLQRDQPEGPDWRCLQDQSRQASHDRRCAQSIQESPKSTQPRQRSWTKDIAVNGI
ncbi:hypothetical protein EDD86DRAFT_265187 [Gorgonomyces haynaldii]|nr:hypothetical protein EDD86DRAFT_265187 [Gorgonomyces haynaldii]